MRGVQNVGKCTLGMYHELCSCIRWRSSIVVMSLLTCVRAVNSLILHLVWYSRTGHRPVDFALLAMAVASLRAELANRTNGRAAKADDCYFKDIASLFCSLHILPLCTVWESYNDDCPIQVQDSRPRRLDRSCSLPTLRHCKVETRSDQTTFSSIMGQESSWIDYHTRSIELTSLGFNRCYSSSSVRSHPTSCFKEQECSYLTSTGVCCLESRTGGGEGVELQTRQRRW